MTEYCKEYIEDFNTATFPHVKYYNYEKWEMEEYKRKEKEVNSKKGPISDEFKHLEEMKRKAMEKERKEMQIIRSAMSQDKVKEMKRQARLKSEMENAYKVGDEMTRKKLQRRLEPDVK